MDAKISVSHIGGSLAVPPSKSAAHRAVLCAALADGTSRIDNIEYSDDIRATLDAVTQLGARVTRQEHSVTIQGCGGGFATVTRPVFCNESGSTLRFLIPVFSLTAQKIRFTGAGRLFARPQEIYRALFTKQSLRFEQAPEGLTIFGRLRPGVFTLPGDVSSQFISGLLFAAPLMESPSTIQILPPFESRSYVGMTLDALSHFGVQAQEAPGPEGKTILTVPAPQTYRPCDRAVEGDYSQAAFPAVLGTLTGGVTVTGLAEQTRQGDRGDPGHSQNGAGPSSPGWGTATGLTAACCGLPPSTCPDCPDLGPVLMAMACFCSGTTVITNAGPPPPQGVRPHRRHADRAGQVRRPGHQRRRHHHHRGLRAARALPAAGRPQRPPGGHEPGGGGAGGGGARPDPRGQRGGQELAGIFRRPCAPWVPEWN